MQQNTDYSGVHPIQCSKAPWIHFLFQCIKIDQFLLCPPIGAVKTDSMNVARREDHEDYIKRISLVKYRWHNR